MARSVALTHLVRHENGTSEGVWAGHTLRSAFQPIFQVRDGKLALTAYEGLLRAFRDGEPVSPVQFFASIPTVDRLHVETLTRTMHLLNAATCLDEKAWLFVNFDPSVFVDRAAADLALREMRLVLHEAGIDAQRVVCEVTEHPSGEQEAFVGFVEALRHHGFRIAVDDYGAEESDVFRVAELRPDIVKFDASWVARLMDTSAGFGLLRTLVEKFEERDIRTVFEGIEDADHVDLAVEAGASLLQGYALGRPEIATPRRLDFATSARADEIRLPTAGPDMDIKRPLGRRDRAFGKRAAAQ